MVPDTSRTSVPGSTLSAFPTMTTLPAAKATSVTASSFWEGSITRPPRSTKSKGIAISECDSEGSASVAQDHAVQRFAQGPFAPKRLIRHHFMPLCPDFNEPLDCFPVRLDVRGNIFV